MMLTPGRRRSLAALALVLPLAVGCQSAPRSRADVATERACRAEADRVYAAQNRADLSYRDQRDTPFAGSYNSGITTRGLGSRFGLSNQVSSCISSNSGPDAGPTPVEPGGTGPTFSPQVR